MKWSALTLSAAFAAVATSASALEFVPAGTCWADFDTGGNWFCGLRTTACGGEGQLLRCSVGAPPANTPPPPYNDPAPPAKSVALDDGGWVYLVGQDNQIYREWGSSWTVFSPQPGMSCIKKLVAKGWMPTGPVLFALDCTGHAKRLVNGVWSTIAAEVQDISLGPNGSADYFFYTKSTGSRPLFEAPSDTGDFIQVLKDTRLYYQSFGQPASAWASSFAGQYFAFDTLQECAGTVFPRGLLWNSMSSTMLGPDPFATLPGNPDQHCPGLQVPPEGFNAPGTPVLKMVHAGGHAGTVFWIRTNVSRVYRLAQ